MNRETGAWLAVALLSVSALGVSATTLESTVSTDANDVIDLDYDRLPIGQDDASTVLNEIEGSAREGETSQTNANDGDPTQSAATKPGGSESEPSAGQDGGQGSQAQQQEQQRQQQQQQSSQDEGSDTSGLVDPSLLDRLLALLTSLLPYLGALAVLLTAAGLAHRYRDRLADLFGQSDTDEGDGDEGVSSVDPAESVGGNPAHQVERSWLEMVRRLDLERPGTMTTSECASAAIAAGLDRDAVRTLTETYEEVKYGGRPVNDRRERVARESRHRLDDGGSV